VPYTYIGTGKLINPEVSSNPNKTLHFEIILDQELPKDLEKEFVDV